MSSGYLYDVDRGPVHIDNGELRALCGQPVGDVANVIGAPVCTRCAGISLRAEADRIDPQPSKTEETMPHDPVSKAAADAALELQADQLVDQTVGVVVNFTRRLDNYTLYDLLRDLPEERFERLVEAAGGNYHNLSRMMPPTCQTCKQLHWGFMACPEVTR